MAKILLIEDDGEIRKLIKDFLKSQNHEVDEAYNALMGIEKVKKKESDYNIVITDNKMPAVSGIGIVPTIKKHSKAKIICISGFFDKKDILEGKKSGVNEFLVKPFRMNQLDAVITNILYEESIKAG